jgi:hypothetical protein
VDPLGFEEMTDKQDLITSLIETLSPLIDEYNEARVCKAFVMLTNRIAVEAEDKLSVDVEIV